MVSAFHAAPTFRSFARLERRDDGVSEPTKENERPGRPSARRHRRTRTLQVIGALTAVTVLGAACSSSSNSGGDHSSGQPASSSQGGGVTLYGHHVTANASLVAELPASIKSAGVLKNISYNNSPPDEFELNGKQVGWNIDLGRAVAATLGLKWQSEASGAFDTFIPSLQNGRYNTVFSALFETPERVKVVDMVTFLNAGTGFMTKSGSSISVAAVTDLCGHQLSYLTGQSFQTRIPAIQAECKSAGKPDVKVLTFPTNEAVLLALKSGRTEIWAQQYTGVTYTVKNSNNQYAQQPFIYNPAPEGAAITRGVGLTKPIKEAIDALIANGTYKAILDHWGITKGLVTSATIYSSTG